MKNIDAFELTANLIKCPSVTPDEGGAITLLDELLSQNGFECTRIERGGVRGSLLMPVRTVSNSWPSVLNYSSLTGVHNG